MNPITSTTKPTTNKKTTSTTVEQTTTTTTQHAKLTTKATTMKTTQAHTQYPHTTVPVPTKQFKRLSTSVMPIEYDVTIEPHMYAGVPVELFSFDGDVNIRLKCHVVTDVIQLNYKEMNITDRSISFTPEDPNEKTSVSGIIQDPATQLLTFNLDKPLVKDAFYSLQMSFKGPLQKDLKGFYLSSYTQGEDVK